MLQRFVFLVSLRTDSSLEAILMNQILLVLKKKNIVFIARWFSFSKTPSLTHLYTWTYGSLTFSSYSVYSVFEYTALVKSFKKLKGWRVWVLVVVVVWFCQCWGLTTGKCCTTESHPQVLEELFDLFLSMLCHLKLLFSPPTNMIAFKLNSDGFKSCLKGLLNDIFWSYYQDTNISECTIF